MNVRSAVVRLLLLVLAALVGSPAFTADSNIYRSRDAQGNVIFSDRQNEASEAIRLPRTNTVPEMATPGDSPEADRSPDATPVEQETGYRRLAITAPHEGETIAHPTGYVKVAVAVDPPLRARHSLRLLLDGEPAGIPQQGSMELSGLTRGEHTLQLVVADDDGNVVQESAAITVQILRPGRRGGTRGLPLPPPTR